MYNIEKGTCWVHSLKTQRERERERTFGRLWQICHSQALTFRLGKVSSKTCIALSVPFCGRSLCTLHDNQAVRILADGSAIAIRMARLCCGHRSAYGVEDRPWTALCSPRFSYGWSLQCPAFQAETSHMLNHLDREDGLILNVHRKVCPHIVVVDLRLVEVVVLWSALCLPFDHLELTFQQCHTCGLATRHGQAQ